jgi:hypothetical protein
MRRGGSLRATGPARSGLVDCRDPERGCLAAARLRDHGPRGARHDHRARIRARLGRLISRVWVRRPESWLSRQPPLRRARPGRTERVRTAGQTNSRPAPLIHRALESSRAQQMATDVGTPFTEAEQRAGLARDIEEVTRERDAAKAELARARSMIEVPRSRWWSRAHGAETEAPARRLAALRAEERRLRGELRALDRTAPTARERSRESADHHLPVGRYLAVGRPGDRESRGSHGPRCRRG